MRRTSTGFLRNGVGDRPGLAAVCALLLFLLSHPVIADLGSLAVDILFSAMLIAGAAVTGQLFIAALLARLVSLHIARKKNPND